MWVVELFRSYDYEGVDVFHIGSGDEDAMKDLFSSVKSSLIGELVVKKDYTSFLVEPDKGPAFLNGDRRGVRVYKQEDISSDTVREFLGYPV